MKKPSYKKPGVLYERPGGLGPAPSSCAVGGSPHPGLLAPPRAWDLDCCRAKAAAGHNSSLHRAAQALLFGESSWVACPLLITSLLVCTQGEQGIPGVSGDPGFQGDKVILSDASSPTSVPIVLA